MQSQPSQGRALTTPPPLPDPSLVDRVLFESPLLGPGPMVIAAVVAVFTMNARARLVKGLVIAATLLVVAGGLLALSTLITTPREAVLARTRELVGSVARADAGEVSEALSDDPEVRYAGFSAPSREALVATIVRTMGPGGVGELQSWRISELQGTIDGPRVARSQALVRATHKATALPASAWVLMHWERGEDGRWRCFAVEPLDIR